MKTNYLMRSKLRSLNSETGFFAALTLITYLIKVKLHMVIVLGFRGFLINESYISALRMMLG